MMLKILKRYCVYVIIAILLVACTTNYNGLHKNYEKFSDDVNYCLKKTCESQKMSFLNNFSLISSLYAYGGGGGSGGGALAKNNFSYKIFNACLKEKGYYKDKDGFFELPALICE